MCMTASDTECCAGFPILKLGLRVIETPGCVGARFPFFGPDAPEGSQSPHTKVVVDTARKCNHWGISQPRLEDLKLPRSE